MTNLCIAYVAAFFLPLLFQSWRIAILGLGVQGLLLGCILAAHQHPWSIPLVFEYANLLLIRAVLVPWYLFRRMRHHETVAEFSLISKNLVQWLVASALLLVAFMFGDKMAPTDSMEAMQVGTAAGSILIALLVLANQNHPLGQIVGLFMFEGGITLVELLSPHAMPFSVSIGMSLVLLVFLITCGQYLDRMLASPADGGDREPEVKL